MKDIKNSIEEFDSQVKTLLNKGYPKRAGLSDEEFLSHINPLKKLINKDQDFIADFEKGYISFVIVVKSTLIDSETAMGLVKKNNKLGVINLKPNTSSDFKPLSEIVIPSKLAYLLISIDRGKESINLPPKDAFEIIKKKNASPITIDEGIAIVTQYPDFLVKNNCFSLLGSRTGKDKKVPAIWINSKQEPNLGWCWDGNPHTWLGSAFCGKRS